MKTKIWAAATMIMAAVLVLPLGSMAGKFIPISEQGKQNSKAAEHSQVIELKEGHLVLTPGGPERIVFIHYRKGFAKPPWAGGGKNDQTESKCYGFLGKGTKWRSLPVEYVINPTNPDDLDAHFVSDGIVFAAEEWDEHTTGTLYGGFMYDDSATWDPDSPDFTNEIVFGDYSQPGVIAVTIAWGYFSGPPSTREIVEFDILFDTDFVWGDATSEYVMDLQNIAAHEIGHGLGLADLYEDTCAEETMYGYSKEGEIKKRSLNPADIAGIQELYGE
jgi:hypothetical protein